MQLIHSGAGVTDSPEIGKAFEANGIVTNYHDSGVGSPVLLIHGSGPGVTAWANWRLSIPVLSRRARVIAPDMAGFGYTVVKDSRTPDKAVWLRQLVDLLDHLGLRKVSIVGNSFGGAIALAFSKAYPERIDRLVLMGAVGVSFPLTDGLNKVWGYTPSTEAMRELLNVFVYDSALITEDLVKMRHVASARADVQSRFSALFPAPRQRWIDMLALEEGEIRKIKTPVLLIHGENDKVIPVEASLRMRDLLPEVRLEIIEKCGHWVQIEHPQTFMQLVENFLFS